MSYRIGLTVLFSLLIIVLQEKATIAAGAGEACTSNTDCTTPADALICDTTSATAADHKCKIKSGQGCTGHENDCVDGATCSGSSTKQCACLSWRSPATDGICAGAPARGAPGGSCTSGTACTDTNNNVCEDNICKIKHGADCTSHADLCVHGATCPTTGTKNCACDPASLLHTQQGTCAAASAAGAPGGSCTSGTTCTDTNNNVCEDNICKIKHGADCTSHADLCVNGATCPTTGTKNCACDAARLPSTAQGTCAAAKVPVSGDCSGGKTCADALVCEGNVCKIKHDSPCTNASDKCVEGAACNTTLSLCKCSAGRTQATDGKCTVNNGATSLLASSLLLVFGVFVMSRLS